MGKLRERRRDLLRDREKAGRKLDKKLHQRGEKRREARRLEDERANLREKIRRKRKRTPQDDARERELGQQIALLLRQARAMTKQIESLSKDEVRLTDRIEALRTRRSKLAEKAADLWRRIRRKQIVVKAGAPHWGGCEDILRKEIVPFCVKQGAPEGSGKRSETYGNPDSDHHVSQVWASARDFLIANAHWLRNKLAAKLGIGSSTADYVAYYIRRAGHTFRVQMIAATHGTGPHFHVGTRFVR